MLNIVNVIFQYIIEIYITMAYYLWFENIYQMKCMSEKSNKAKNEFSCHHTHFTQTNVFAF
jgi:hypothetical protein